MGYMHSKCENCDLDCTKCKLYIDALAQANREVEEYQQQLKWEREHPAPFSQ